MTPGMIELGDRQVIENETIAEQAGRFLDLAIVVGATNKDALLRGFAKSGLASEKIYAVPTREEAFRRLSEIESPGDIILIENDLPDLYESNARF